MNCVSAASITPSPKRRLRARGSLRASALACPGARGAASLPPLRRTPAVSARRGAGSLRGDAEMRADLAPGRAGVVGFRYCPIARHTGGDCLAHARDCLSAARVARLRPLAQCLGESCAIALPAGNELEPRDDLLAA